MTFASGNFAEYRLDISTSQLTKIPRSSWYKNTLTVLGSIKNTLIISDLDPSTNILSLSTQSKITSSDQTSLKNVKAYSAVLVASELYVIYSLTGLSGLYMKKLTFDEYVARSAIKEITVFFDRMDEFD